MGKVLIYGPLAATLAGLVGCMAPRTEWPSVIAAEAYAGRTDLRHIGFPETVTEIGPAAFAGCSRLKTVAVAASVSRIGAAAFADTPDARFTVSPENPVYRSDEDGALLNADGTVLLRAPGGHAAYTVPDSVRVLACGAFSGQEELETVALPAGLRYIGDRAFAGCTALKRLDLPASVDSIGRFAFSGCRALTVTVDNDNCTYRSAGGLLTTVDGTVVLRGDADLTAVRIPEGVTTVAEGAFSGCRMLRTADFPETLRYLCMGAFADCPDLDTVRFRSYQPEWFVPGALDTGGTKTIRVLCPARAVWRTYPWTRLGPRLRPETL